MALPNPLTANSGWIMSEKLKPNFTPVPHVIFDEILRTLTPGAVKVLFAICRFTYGWGKQSDRISLKQLSEMTGIKDRGNVYRAIKQLGDLVTVKPGDPSRNQASEYALNIEIQDSDLLSDLLSKRHLSIETQRKRIHRRKIRNLKQPGVFILNAPELIPKKKHSHRGKLGARRVSRQRR